MYSPPLLEVPVAVAREYSRLFVNRRAYTMMTDNRHDPSQNRYFRPTRSGRGTPNVVYEELSLSTVRNHIAGKITCMFYAVNPETQRCKWICVDGDYDNAEPDLNHLREELERDGIASLFENSRRGGHLWILNESPLEAWRCRRYIATLAQSLLIPVKDARLDQPYEEEVERPTPTGDGVLRVKRLVTKDVEGIEIFPKQDFIEEGGFGNGIRGPLCVHRKNYERYWFRGAPESLEAQMQLLRDTPKLSEGHLVELTAAYAAPVPPWSVQAAPARPISTSRPQFSIFDYYPAPSNKRDYHVACPSCGTLHLKITVGGRKHGYYNCLQGGCSSAQIREALGVPKPQRRF